jgi:membrane fusion protein, adhesin transport system
MTPALPRPLRAMDEVGSSNSARVLAVTLVVLGLFLLAALIFTPWQQSVSGAGRVSGLNPQEREQTIGAPVEGRVLRWHVTEGSKVRTGDTIVELADNDPLILDRIAGERRAIEERQLNGERRVEAHDDRLQRLIDAQLNAVSAGRNRVHVASDRILQSEQSIVAAKEREIAAQLNTDRQNSLLAKGLTSQRTLELARQEVNTARALVTQAEAALSAARNDKLASEDDLKRIQADTQAAIEAERATLNMARAEISNVKAELQRLDVRLARQGTLRVEAPRNGTILRLLAQPGSELLKAGEPLVAFVPDAYSPTVELGLNGVDMPLVQKGNLVRLQFNGWPALQFVGWPSVAVGTFGGVVQLVDAAESNGGKFRILVVPDPNDDPWPSAQYLRQGVQAKGWVLLKQVPLGWELWRRFNGFPPVIAENEPGAKPKKK